MTAEELFAFGQPALLPLALLTKGGANRTMVEEMFESLLANRLLDLLPASNLLASLALGDGDQEWLRRRYKNMTDILKDTPAYHWMTDDAREEGIEEGHKRALQEAQEAVYSRLREKVVAVVAARFPKLARFTRKQISDVEDMDTLLNLIVDLKLADKVDDVTQRLLALNEEEPAVS